MSSERPSIADLKRYYIHVHGAGFTSARWMAHKRFNFEINRGLEIYSGNLGNFPAEFDLKGDHEPTSLRQYIEYRLEHLPSGTKLRLLDVGCGKARFFRDLADQFGGERFDCTGVSIADYRDKTAKDELEEMGAKYIVDDARGLRSLLQRHDVVADGGFDLITSSKMLPYIIPERMRQEIIKTIYRLLAMGGVAGIDGIALFSNREGALGDYQTAKAQLVKGLNEMFRRRGLKIQIINKVGGAILMQKNDQPFYLPIPYDRMGNVVDIRLWNDMVQSGQISLDNPQQAIGWERGAL